MPENGAEVTCELQVFGLTEDANAPDGMEGLPVVMEIECHEEGYLAKILLQEGESAEPDTAMAVLVEEERHVAAVCAAFSGASKLPPVEPASFAWQAFLRADQTLGPACSNS